jgi:hypothetical protein
MDNNNILERICDKDGNKRLTISDDQAKQGQNVGKSIHLNCYICQKYLMDVGEVKYVQTSFRCSQCLMPLCKKDHSGAGTGRTQSCVDEHLSSKCQAVGCFSSDHQHATFPKGKKVQLISRRQARSNNKTSV